MTQYSTKIEFAKGDRRCVQCTEPVATMTQAIIDGFALDAKFCAKGWTVVSVEQVVTSGPQHVVDAIGADMALSVDEIVSGK